MIPKTMHKINQMNRLKVFGGPEHPFKHLFPNEPILVREDNLRVEEIPFRRMALLDDEAEKVWNECIIPIEPDERGFIDNWTHLRNHAPDEYDLIRSESSIKVPSSIFIERAAGIKRGLQIKSMAARLDKRTAYLQKHGLYAGDENMAKDKTAHVYDR
jgi:hypothetical protein